MLPNQFKPKILAYSIYIVYFIVCKWYFPKPLSKNLISWVDFLLFYINSKTLGFHQLRTCQVDQI